MNVRAISRNVGYALLVSALFMLLSVLVSLLNGKDSGYGPLMVSFAITFIVGIFPFIFVRTNSEISLKEGYLVIFLAWIFSFLFGMLPYLMWGGPFTFANAWFESVSGYTTTGATILDDIEALPKSLLFWRSATHFIGGLGVVVFLLLVIPNSSPVRLRLTNMELSSLSRNNYTTTQNRVTYIFASVYLGLFIISALSYFLAGMPFFDAVCHAFSVCASGGFSTRNLSIAAFDSPLIEGLTMLFMLLTSIHFGLIYLAIYTRSIKPFNNPVLKFYLVSLVVIIVIFSLSLFITGSEPTLGRAFWVGAFQSLSASSTTGFAITDNSSWPMLCNYLMLCVALICGCCGSTSGGIKVDRLLVMFKTIGCRIQNVLHPTSVNEVKMGHKVFSDREINPNLVYITLYGCLIGLSVFLSFLCGVNTHSAFAASITSLSNVGPAISELGYMGNFSSLAPAAKLLFSFDMFIGRVEIYPVFVVALMIIDRKKR